MRHREATHDGAEWVDAAAVAQIGCSEETLQVAVEAIEKNRVATDAASPGLLMPVAESKGDPDVPS